MTAHQVLNELSVRLPELQWALRLADKNSLSHSLPAGVFRSPLQGEPYSFIEEIRWDLQVLARCLNDASGQALAQKIRHKIATLVAACRLPPHTKVATHGLESSVLKHMATRKQWVQNLEEQLTRLTEQHAALVHRLSQSMDASLQLNLQAQLGQLQRELTLAKEAYTKAMG